MTNTNDTPRLHLKPALAGAILLLSFAAWLPLPAGAQSVGGAKQTSLLARAYDHVANWLGIVPAPIATMQAACAGANDVGGTVFLDYNANGTKDAFEPGYGPITVTAYNLQNQIVAATTASASGVYNFTGILAANLAIRLEFTGLPAWARPSFHGATPGSAVMTQRHTAGTCSANLAILNPAEYCQQNPQLGVPCYLGGDVANPNISGLPAVVEFAFNSGLPGRQFYESDNIVTVTSEAEPIMSSAAPGPLGTGNAALPVISGRSKIINATLGQIGSVNGAAYHQPSNHFLVASFMKRFTSFPAPAGWNGSLATRPNDHAVGAIYAINRKTDPNTVSEFYYAPSGSDSHDYSNPAIGMPFGDLSARNDVGYKGWGDIETSEKGAHLYAVNMFDSSIHMIPIAPNGSTIVSGPASIISFPNNIACSNNEWRPGGLKIKNGLVYAAVTCTAATSQNPADLHLWVYSFPVGQNNPTFTPVANTSLNYSRPGGWAPWNNASKNDQPWALDLEFDEAGNLFVGVSNRVGDMVTGTEGFFNFTFEVGDTIRATPAGGGAYTFSGLAPEFVDDNTLHPENDHGRLAVVLGTGELIAPALIGNLIDGVRHYTSSTGAPLSYFGLFQLDRVLQDAGEPFGKANGLGDIEPLCMPAPIEIGNYVWYDPNGNGVQDPNEPPIGGVTVELWRGGVKVASAVTGANGEYYFSWDGATGQDWSFTTDKSVLPNTAYVIRISRTQAALTGLIPTTTNYNNNVGNGNEHDSDGDPSLYAGFVATALTTGDPGANDHSFDFGFLASADLSLAKTHAGDFCNGNVVTYTLTVRNIGPAATETAITVTDTLPAGLSYLSAVAPGWTCSAAGQVVTCTTAGPLAVNATSTITLNVSIGYSVAGNVTNTATVGYTGDPNPANNSITDTASITTGIGAPGQSYPGSGSSVLIYPVYTSSASNPNTQNTKITLTNIHDKKPICVHLFFVDGSSCTVADNYVCLTANQTLTFLASDLDPGTTGYLVAVAVDCATGCPANFNFLVGDEHAKFATGHAANLAAQGVPALPALATCNDQSVTAALNFDGVSYGMLPRALALSNIPSKADGNDTLLILNRIGGRLDTGAATLNSIFGILYDDAETAFSFSFSPGTCQFRASLSNNFPRTAPRFESALPAGRSGWLKLWSQNDQALIGAAINFNGNAASNSTAYNQGHGLHTLTRTAGASLTIPVFPPSC